jgi:hypothetical protein
MSIASERQVSCHAPPPRAALARSTNEIAMESTGLSPRAFASSTSRKERRAMIEV